MNARSVPTGRAELARGLLWISPWVVGLVLFTGAPAALSLYYSLTDYSLLEPPVFVGLDNYRELAGDAMFWTVVKNTLVYALGSVVGGTLLSIALAVLLERPLRGAAMVRAIVFLPTLVPAVSGAVCWLWLFNGRYGLFNSALGRLGVSGPDWLGDPRMAMPSLIAMSLWVVGSAVLVYGAALRGVPASLYEAADMDGVSAWGRLRHVTLPMISPAILFNAVMSLIWSLQVFGAPYIMTRGGPENTTYSYAMYVYNNAFAYGRMGYASALAWMQIVGIVALTLGVLRLTRGFVYYRAA